MPLNYTVKQGDCIFSIAFEKGFFADTIWNHANNAELKKKRADPNVLLPGDTVFVPDKRLKEVSEPTNQVHKFRCKNTPKILRVQLVCLDVPVKNLAYKIDVDGREKEGKTDGEGWLTQSIPPDAKIAKIAFEDGSKYELKLGSLNPIDEPTGIQQRLQSLGFYEGAINNRLNDETVEALKTFQRSYELETTGEADERTKELLIKMTGE